MALRSGRWIALLLLFCLSDLHAQTVYYPEQCSDILKSTADDVAGLFGKAISGVKFSSQPYTVMPKTGIVFIYDSTITNTQSCKIESDGNTLLQFSASQDNGLCFGIYYYLNSLGFRFYLPGTIWEKIPQLLSPYQRINKIISGNLKYNSWFISGGCNRWAMDNDESFGLDTYAGSNGHEWAKYQRRNNMTGAYYFNGHRGDIFDAQYAATLQKNLCYVACSNGKRIIDAASVPDINNNNSEEYWASEIEQRYTSYKKTILSSPGLYANYYHNLSFDQELIGIEVPDGSRWGNSTDNLGCFFGNFNGNPYPKESDQSFLLANFTAEKINTSLGDKHFQCYAYSGHADIPSSSISINKNIDVQVVPTAFQFETSAKALMNRWYNLHPNISEYQYLNIPQWTGETPIFSLNDYKNTLVRLKEKNSQGIVTEASPAKFASLPFLFAGNRFLLNNISVDSSLEEFISTMFSNEAGVHIKQLLQYWGDENVGTSGNFTGDNKYKIPLYLQELNNAIGASKNIDSNMTARFRELKAYLHYMVLYYDLITDPNSYQNKSDKVSSLCLYLAKINKLQLVNSYFLILDLVDKFPVNSSLYQQYNVSNGSAYQGGNLPLITNSEIDKNFSLDLSKYGNQISNYTFLSATEIISKINAAGLRPLDEIKVTLSYTNGYNYSNRSDFYFYAPNPGTFKIYCDPTFGMPGYGFINLSIEADDRPLLIVKDQRITKENNPGMININIPSSGMYKLSFVSQFQTSANITITTNGNIFFKKGPFYGDKIENYQRDNWASFPKYVFVPGGIDQLYGNINNACYTNTCLAADAFTDAFGLKDQNGKIPEIKISDTDSSLFKISIPQNIVGSFLQISKMREYNLCFDNISNIELYAEQKPEAAYLPVTQPGLTVYPNPSTGIFNFKKDNTSIVFNKINIYNALGKVMTTYSNTSSINLSAMPAGIYFFSGEKLDEIVKGKLIKN